MINATLMKTVALAALLSMASACQAADLTVGKHLSTQELAQYASAPTVQIETQSFKVLSSGTRTKAAGAASAAVTQVANERGVVGEVLDELAVDLVERRQLAPAPRHAQEAEQLAARLERHDEHAAGADRAQDVERVLRGGALERREIERRQKCRPGGERLRGEFRERARLADQRAVRGVGSRVVDQDVDAAEALQSEVHAAPRGVLVDRVGADAEGLLTDLRRGLVGGFLLARGEHHVGARGGQLLGDRQPDPARGAGDDRGAAGQIQ